MGDNRCIVNKNDFSRTTAFPKTDSIRTVPQDAKGEGFIFLPGVVLTGCSNPGWHRHRRPPRQSRCRADAP